MNRLLSLLFHDVYERERSDSGFPGAIADRYKLSLAAFDAQLAGLVRVLRTAPALLPCASQSVERVPVAITVDDGGVSYYTLLAERLEARGWRGHCFVTTGYIGRSGFLDAAQVRELHLRGHVIGTHSVSHPARFATLSWSEMVREWQDSRKALQDVLGADVTVGSVPGGYFSRRVAEAADAAGLAVLFTSEPETTVRRVGNCGVVGRFTVRHGCADEFCARLASLHVGARAREWGVWNAKKALKRVLGAGYPHVTQWISRVNQ